MKIFPVFCLLPTVAFGALVEPLPAPEFADTEVSTNIPFAVSFDAMSRIEKKSKLDEAWNLVKVTRRGRGDIGEITFVNGYRPGCVLEVR